MMVSPCRQYCARRLQRLYKALKFTHGRGKFQKKELQAKDVTDDRLEQTSGCSRLLCTVCRAQTVLHLLACLAVRPISTS